MLKLSVREKLHRSFLFEKARLDEDLGSTTVSFGKRLRSPTWMMATCFLKGNETPSSEDAVE